MAARCEQRPRERGCGRSESLLLHLTGVANRPRTHNKKNTTFNKNAVLVDNSAQCIYYNNTHLQTDTGRSQSDAQIEQFGNISVV